MGRVEDAGQQAKGKIQEAAGKATGDEDLEAQGEAEQAEAEVSQAARDFEDELP
jgi:uncharacterized protein YjbJ (UPF0337 family)